MCAPRRATSRSPGGHKETCIAWQSTNLDTRVSSPFPAKELVNREKGYCLTGCIRGFVRTLSPGHREVARLEVPIVDRTFFENEALPNCV